MRAERVLLGWDTVGERFGKHQPVDRRLGADRTCKGRACARKAGLINRIGRVESIAYSKGQGVTYVRFRIEVSQCWCRARANREFGEIDATRIDHAEFQ